jgi:hypothetical protein
MESHTHDTKGPSIRENRGTSIKRVHPTYISFSDPEDNDSSGVESFDEDDIYDGSENGDDVIYPIPDSEAQSPVCPPPHSRSPDST